MKGGCEKSQIFFVPGNRQFPKLPTTEKDINEMASNFL